MAVITTSRQQFDCPAPPKSVVHCAMRPENKSLEGALDHCGHNHCQSTKLNFYIFGNDISHSLSPVIHNTAFEFIGLPHKYSIHQSPAVDESVRRLIQSPQFGGASVTYPHKLSIHSLLDSVSESAEKIGAVNTVIVQNSPLGRTLRGDNTDWLGILECMRKKSLTVHTGIVVGAGGAARAATFAMQHLGVPHVAIVNRSRTSAEKLAAQFPGLRITIHERLSSAPSSNLIVGCIPADDVTEEDIPAHLFDEEGAVIEMSYRPPVSALMKVAKRRSGWMVFSGVDVLREQAYAQFELWTGRKAPVAVIERALAEHTASLR